MSVGDIAVVSEGAACDVGAVPSPLHATARRTSSPPAIPRRLGFGNGRVERMIMPVASPVRCREPAHPGGSRYRPQPSRDGSRLTEEVAGRRWYRPRGIRGHMYCWVYPCRIRPRSRWNGRPNDAISFHRLADEHTIEPRVVLSTDASAISKHRAATRRISSQEPECADRDWLIHLRW